MPLHAFLDLRGKKTGEIKGSARQKTRKGKISVIAYTHTIQSKRWEGTPGERSGQPNGDLVHGRLVITKELDHATPKLRKAMAEGDSFDRFELHCWRVPPAGGGPNGVTEENHWTVHLHGARIAAIRTVMPYARAAANQMIPEYEEVEFSYERIGTNWSALTGTNAEVGQADSGVFEASFSDTDDLDQLGAILSSVGKKVGESVAKDVAGAIQAAAKDYVKELLKDK
ncbi:MAG: type VI secretion system tube protein Hcp [Planctomycetes bacterium]|nr:type VI secretion system tube protein Hcp [Planctomycetota bacterium]